MSQSRLHHEHFNMCRICLVDAESSSYGPFVHITTPINGEFVSKQRMLDLLGINVDADDVKPKIICNYCAISLETWDTMKKKAAESEIVINYMASKKFGVTMSERSIASTSSLMLRNTEETSQEPLFNHSRLPSKRSLKIGSSMPGTSKATTLMMLSESEESSQEPPFNHSRLQSKRSYKFDSSMPSTSKASTSAMMFRDNEESFQEPPFNHSRLPSKQLFKLGSSMPGTSKASTSAMMFRDNEELSQEQPSFSHSRLPSKLFKLGSSMPGTSKASTSAMMSSDSEESSQELSFNHSRLPSKQSYKFDSSKPSTSKASTSAMMFRDNEESSQESPFNHSRLPSKRSYKFDSSKPSTSKASTSTMVFKDNEESSQEPPFKRSQSISKRSKKNRNKLNVCNSNPFITSHLNSVLNNDSDDDSCILVTTQIETIELITDEEDSDNIENECTSIDVSYYEETVESSQNEEIIEISSDSDDGNDLKNEYFNNGTDKLYYCSICQKKKYLNHDCSQHTKSFFTCLVPCCNVLSRSKKDFIFHYKPHIGMSSSEVMCHLCFKGIAQSNIDGNGCHLHCDTSNAFKCYSCNVRFNSMQELAFHKLKTHNGILMDSQCNYLCLYCEESSTDILEITKHIKHCIENQSKKVTAAMELKKPMKNETEPVKINTTEKIKKVVVRTNGNNKKIPCTSQHILFTCLKPSCNKIFQSFTNFKYHYRRHFELGNALVCWQCCNTFSGIPDLRTHQAKNNCRIPGMYNCPKCPSNFDDLENLSIHKLTYHGGKLIASKKNNKTIMCAFCQMDINIFEFKSHLVTCLKKDNKINTRTKKDKDTYTCLACKRVFESSISLSNHMRAHNPSRINLNVKKE